MKTGIKKISNATKQVMIDMIESKKTTKEINRRYRGRYTNFQIGMIKAHVTMGTYNK